MTDVTMTAATPMTPDELRALLGHAEAMAEEVTIDVDLAPRRVVLHLSGLQLVAPAVVEAPAVEADDEGDACPADPDGQHHVGCDDVDDDQVPDEAPAERTPAPPGFAPNGNGTTKQAILDHLRIHGPVTDPGGRASVRLADALGWDHGSTAFQRHLKQLADAGLITRDMPHPRKTARIALAGDDVVFPVSNRDLVLAALVEHGPIVKPSGTAVTTLMALSGVDMTRSGFSYLLRDLIADGAVVKRGSQTRTRWIGTAAQAAADDDPATALEADSVEETEDDEVVDVPGCWDMTDWSFMRRTDRADREAAAGPRPNVLDAVEGPDDKGRPLIDSVEVVEELSDEDLAKILGNAGGRG